MYQGTYIEFKDFSGGYCGNYPPSSLELNQSPDCADVVILPNKQGIRTRNGNTIFSSSITTDTVHGIGFLYTGSQKFLGVVAGSKFYGGSGSSATPGSTFTDKTGTLTIADPSTSTTVDETWTFCTFNSVLIGFGGQDINPDAPFKWTGSGNATALGGSPPSAYAGFTTNNRVFGYRTAANVSTIYWSIVGSADDWTGAGSGSAVVGSLSDNQFLTGHAVLPNNVVLLFKSSSTHIMSSTTAPFPIYAFSNDIGCVGKQAVIVVEGRAYWINQYKRMVSSDGNDLVTFPPAADNLWDAINSNKQLYIRGFRQKGLDHDWLVWTSDSTTTIVWDLINKCWLNCTTGFGSNQVVSVTDTFTGQVYFGGNFGTAGRIYKADVTQAVQDFGSSDIGAYWTSPYLSKSNLNEITRPRNAIIHYKSRAGSTNCTFSYSFNFSTTVTSQVFSTAPAIAAEGYAAKRLSITGLGTFFQWKVILGSVSGSQYYAQIDKVVIEGKTSGQRKFYMA